MSELRECPFCGSDRVDYEWCDEFVEVGCRSCGCIGPTVHGEDDEDTCLRRTFELWNTRKGASE